MASAAAKYASKKNEPVKLYGGLVLIPFCLLPLTFAYSALFKPHIFDVTSCQYLAFSGIASAVFLMINSPNSFGVRIFSSANVFMGAAFAYQGYQKYLLEQNANNNITNEKVIENVKQIAGKSEGKEVVKK